MSPSDPSAAEPSLADPSAAAPDPGATDDPGHPFLRLADFAALSDADELMVTNPAPLLPQRIRTLEILAGLDGNGS